jgi:hypothetical protein
MSKKIHEYKDMKQSYIQCCGKFQTSPLTQISKKIDEAIIGKPLTHVYKSNKASNQFCRVITIGFCTNRDFVSD